VDCARARFPSRHGSPIKSADEADLVATLPLTGTEPYGVATCDERTVGMPSSLKNGLPARALCTSTFCSRSAWWRRAAGTPVAEAPVGPAQRVRPAPGRMTAKWGRPAIWRSRHPCASRSIRFPKASPARATAVASARMASSVQTRPPHARQDVSLDLLDE